MKNQKQYKTVPGDRGNFLLGNVSEIQRHGILQFYLDSWQKFGDLFRFYIGPKALYVVTNPYYVQHILVDSHQSYGKGAAYDGLKLLLGEGLFTSDGELWQRQRRLMQPFFTENKIKKFGAAMSEATLQMLERWQPYVENGESLEITAEMERLTMSIIGQTMLSVDTGDRNTEIGQALKTGLTYIAQRATKLFNVPLFIPTASNCPFKQARNSIDKFIYNLIAERRNDSQQQPKDLLSELLQARDDESGKGISEKQLRDEILTIFVAGSDTTTTALTWTWYLLSQHPEVKHKLYAELETVLGGRTPTVEDMPRLKYTKMVILESLRLYPPVWTIPRSSVKEDVVDGYHIPANSTVLISQYIAHRHPDFWPEPEKFEPERFTPEKSKERPTYAYFPFGGGPRTCLGIHFSMLEAQLILATVAQRYELNLVPGHVVEAETVAQLRPKYGLKMTLQNRIPSTLVISH
ncbi:cytochrome P450 [Nostoc sp. CENA67]|uniref:Cytochrome P450 n=1 Tax=Amazonocrinis nigriterrae CENA67 TaxID=2794033 RepID=A0A8J7L8D5_9NOST|nr:cytochrome P450 [Amazonocrinis nigriterrae]MBH8561916.1 cytochrome P450 [Amazonocrinis nigriterrae CENA67]